MAKYQKAWQIVSFAQSIRSQYYTGAGETEVWVEFSKDFGYIKDEKYDQLMQRYDEVNRMLYGMMDKADKFCR